MIDYQRRLSEVNEVLKYLSKEDLKKIPEDVRKLIEENKDNNYIWKYDESKKLADQGLSRETIAILSYLNMEYLLLEDQKALLEKMHKVNSLKEEQQKSIKYDNNVFINNEKIDEEKQEILVINEKSKNSFLNKFLLIIRKIFQKN